MAELETIKIKPSDKVLIVDDQAEVRDVLVEILEREGQECLTADSAEDALRKMASCCVDLVLTDMHMPGASGLDLIEQVRRIDDSIPVILITGFPSIDSAVDAMKHGAVDFIPKPFDIRSVRHMVANALDERRLRQQNKQLQAEANKAAVIEKLNRELNEKLEELTRLYHISEALTEFMDSQSIFNQVVKIASQATGAQRVSVMMLDRSRSKLKIRSSKGISEEIAQTAQQDVGSGVAGRVAQSGQAIQSAHVGAEVLSERGGEERGYDSESFLSTPFMIGDQVFGVMNLTDKIDRSNFSARDESIIGVLLEKAGIKLENQALYEGIYANLIDSLNALITTIEAKDHYTREHSQRVTEYAVKIGQLLGVSEDELEMIEFATILHDVGKIGVRDEILTKSGALTDEEFEAIKQHPIIGEKIIAPLGLSPVERAIVRNHHERVDGRGYPDGLKGEDIPYLARIVCVADAFDAMTTTRSYRSALSVESAVEELKRHRGTQFDPAATDAMLRAINEGMVVVDPRWALSPQERGVA